MELCVISSRKPSWFACCCFLKSAIVKILVKDDYKKRLYLLCFVCGTITRHREYSKIM